MSPHASFSSQDQKTKWAMADVLSGTENVGWSTRLNKTLERNRAA